MQDERIIKVGVDQINNPTPPVLKYILRAFQFLSGCYALIPQELLHLSDDQYATVNKWLLVGNAIMFFGVKFFGLDYKSDDYGR